jgi:hypothetical protein
MKPQKSASNLFLGSVLAAVCALLALAGCTSTSTSMAPASQESLLQKAGFQSRTPTTAKQKAVYAKLPANQLHRVTVNGRTIYGYKDERAGVVWVGNEAQYAHYRQLAAKANLKADQITPAEAALEKQDMHTYSSWYEGRIP